jgi:glycosyltransferase involved in cell wall biosynthesis
MSSGVCPIVTDVGGNRDVLGPELSHLLVQPGDMHGLVAAWLHALRDRKKRQQDGMSARRRVCESFSLGTMVSRYEHLYERLYSDRSEKMPR